MNNECGGGEISPWAIPQLCEGLELTGMDVSPDEGYLLSRLDGLTNVAILCQTTGLGEDQTLQILSSLQEKGIIIFREHDRAATPEPDQTAEPGAEAAAPEEATPKQMSPELTALKKVLRKALPRGEDLIPLVEEIFVNLENLSYYDLLGLAKGVPEGEVKKAYLVRTKVFHPDRFYRRAEPEFKRKLQEIFKQTNKGYKILCDPEQRKTYDESLTEEEHWEQEDKQETAESAAPAGSRTRTVKGVASPWKQIRVAKQKPIEEKYRTPPKKEEKKPSGPKLKLGLKDKQPIGHPLLKKIEKMKEQESGEQAVQAEKFYKGAMVEKSRGNFNAARINLQLAVQYYPDNEKYKQALADLDQAEAGKKAEAKFRAGIEARAAGDLRGALMHFREAMNAGYETSRLYHQMAELMIELDGNNDRARALCLKAMELDKDVPAYHMTLARAYKGLGQKAAAIVQLEKVLKLEPKNKVAAKELKALQKS